MKILEVLHSSGKLQRKVISLPFQLLEGTCILWFMDSFSIFKDSDVASSNIIVTQPLILTYLPPSNRDPCDYIWPTQKHRRSLPLKIFNLIIPSEYFLPCIVTYSQVINIRTCKALGDILSHFTIWFPKIHHVYLLGKTHALRPNIHKIKTHDSINLKWLTADSSQWSKGAVESAIVLPSSWIFFQFDIQAW